MDIYKKLRKGGGWNIISQFGQQIVGFLITIILARVLSPNQFGLLGKVAIITAFIGYFVELGFTPSLMLHSKMEKIDKDTAFWGVFILSIIIYIFVFLGAPLIADFYEDSRLVIIVRIVFIDFLFRPFTVVPLAVENKNLRYDRQAKGNIIALTASGAISVIIALNGGGVWALVWQILVRSLVYGIYLMYFSEWKPSFSISINRLIRFSTKGFHFTVSNLSNFAYENIDFFIVSRMLGDTALGLYTMAFRLSRYFLSKMHMIVGRMLFPAYINMDQQNIDVKENYLKISILISMFLIPIVTFYGIVIDYLVIILIGSDWIETIPLIRLLLPFIAVQIMSFSDRGLLSSKDKIKIVYIVQTIITVFIAMGIFLTINDYGLYGVSIIYTLFSILGFIAMKSMVMQVLKISISEIFKSMKPTLELTGLVFLLILPVKQLVTKNELSPWLGIVLSTLFFITIVYFYLRCKNYLNGRRLNYEAIFSKTI